MKGPCAIPLLFRRAEEADHAYVIRTWLDSYRPEQPDMRTSDFETWMRARMNVNVLLAVHESAPESIVGWAAADEVEPFMGRLHYVYVRRRYRGQGVGRALWERLVAGARGGPVVVTHLTADGRRVKREHPETVRFIP